MNGKTSLNLPENVEAALCYVLGFVTGLVFYILEPDNKYIKFHAIQSMAVFGILWILWFFVNATYYLWPIASLLSLIQLALWIILVIKAYQGEKFKVPIIGDIAEANANKTI